MPRPRASRPPEASARDVTCLANSAAGYSGANSTLVIKPMPVVAPAATDSATIESRLSYTSRSIEARQAKPRCSARRPHCAVNRPDPWAIWLGSPIAICMLVAPLRVHDIEDLAVAAVAGGESHLSGGVDDDLGGVGLTVQQRHRLRDKGIQRHRIGSVVLA